MKEERSIRKKRWSNMDNEIKIVKKKRHLLYIAIFLMVLIAVNILVGFIGIDHELLLNIHQLILDNTFNLILVIAALYIHYVFANRKSERSYGDE